MELKQRIYLIFGRAMPLRYRLHLKELIVYSGQDIDVNQYLGSSTIMAFLFSIASLLIPKALAMPFDIYIILFAIITFLMVEFAAYLAIYFKVEDRTKRVENILPDALQLIAANIRAGMTPYQALKRAAREEFGPLAEELNRATSRALGTESFSDALVSISKRIRSEILGRAIDLFTTAMHSGGHLAKLLEELAVDVEETRSLKKELVTSTKTYVAFIMFTIIIGAPLLLGISIQFITIVTDMQASSGVSDVGFGMSFLAGEVVISADFLVKVSIGLLVVTSVLAAILLGTIREGKPTYGFRYAPIIAIGSLAAFFIFRHVITNFFGSII